MHPERTAPARICTVDDCDRPTCARSLCSGHYQQYRQGKPFTPLLTKSAPGVPSRLLAELLAREPGPADSPCIRWEGAHFSDGYGRAGNQVVTRVVLAAKLGRELSPGMLALHTCPGGDNRWCVNVSHLREGTPADNIGIDAVERGQMARGTRHGTYTKPESRVRGEAQGGSKLSETDVINIRAAYARGERREHLARQYGVTPTAIGFIVKRKTWAHVP